MADNLSTTLRFRRAVSRFGLGVVDELLWKIFLTAVRRGATIIIALDAGSPFWK